MRAGNHTKKWMRKVSSNQNLRCPTCNTLQGGMYDKLYTATTGECPGCASSDAFDKYVGRLMELMEWATSW